MDKLWQKFLALLVCPVLLLLMLGKKKPDSQRMSRLDFNTSTRKMGLRFTEKLRDNWRKQWVKISK